MRAFRQDKNDNRQRHAQFRQIAGNVHGGPAQREERVETDQAGLPIWAGARIKVSRGSSPNTRR
jgi:hypothetical protein